MSRSRRLRRVVSPASIIGTLCLIVAGTGIADATTGGNFVLGRHNAADQVTSLANSDGTALSLTSKAGTPPLTVSNSVVVPHLNAHLLDGLTASQLQRRVTGTCPTGQFVTGVSADAQLECATPSSRATATHGIDDLGESNDWQVPAGITSVTVEMWGGGGGGGCSPGLGGGGGGGGGAGGYFRDVLSVQPGEQLDIKIGGGGNACTGSEAKGDNGDDTTLAKDSDGTVLMTATGGKGGNSGGAYTDDGTGQCETNGSGGYGGDPGFITAGPGVSGGVALPGGEGGSGDEGGCGYDSDQRIVPTSEGIAGDIGHGVAGDVGGEFGHGGGGGGIIDAYSQGAGFPPSDGRSGDVILTW